MKIKTTLGIKNKKIQNKVSSSVVFKNSLWEQ